MRSGSWGRRLVWTQFAVLVTMSLTVTATALIVGPAQFDRHMRAAGHDQPGVLDHAEQAFRAAGLVSLVAGLGVALVIAIITAWMLNRKFARGIDELIAGAGRVSQGDYDHPIQLQPASPELREVADEFNQMAQQIAHTEVTRRRMLTDLAHELRTPLAATQVTLEGLQDGVVPYGPNTLEVLIRQNKRLSALAADISEVSRAEEGRLSLDLHRVAVDDVVRTSVEAFRHPCAQAGVALSTFLDANVTVTVDPTRICQILDNLLRNALQHTHPADTITVTSAVDRNCAVITVSDTGVGVAQDALPHLFERFYRADHSRTRDADGGTGVGLAISRGIARSHEGSLSAASDGPGHGATFTLRLPVAS